MTIYFLRHAEAEDLAESDFDRKLTPKGLQQAAKVGKFCAGHGLEPGERERGAGGLEEGAAGEGM